VPAGEFEEPEDIGFRVTAKGREDPDAAPTVRPRCAALLSGALGIFELEPPAPAPPPPQAVSRNAKAVMAAKPNRGANERFDI